MGKNKIVGLMLLAFAGFIMILLAGCSSGDGSGIRATADALTPRPTATATQDATQPVQATVTPDIAEIEAIQAEAFAAKMANDALAIACDPNMPQPTMTIDATDEAAGVVVRGTKCEGK